MIYYKQLRNRTTWYSLTIVALVTVHIFTTQLFAQRSAKDKFNKKSFVGKQNDGSYIVPTSQIIDPAGTTVTFPGRPVDLALNPDETILAVKNLKDIVFFNTQNQTIKQTLNLPEGGNTFTGIHWSDNGERVWTTDTRGYDVPYPKIRKK